ncbi:hypothetical protein ACFVY9_23020 [Streptomyces sp. NPDC059544]|uniref:hypothetical protein n=1 Tax=Streptomyces sp. NPDC059544 TaxID=3346861 RepID=UPI0036A5353A
MKEPEVLAGSSAGSNGSAQAGAGDGKPAAQATKAGENAPEPNGGGQPVAAGQGGGLAETGAQLWPSAAGAVLLVAGVLLLRTRRPQRAAARRH